MGNVYFQQQLWKDAIKYFDKSLTEHRNADVLKKKQIVSSHIIFLCLHRLYTTVQVADKFLIFARTQGDDLTLLAMKQVDPCGNL